MGRKARRAEPLQVGKIHSPFSKNAIVSRRPLHVSGVPWPPNATPDRRGKARRTHTPRGACADSELLGVGMGNRPPDSVPRRYCFARLCHRVL